MASTNDESELMKFSNLIARIYKILNNILEPGLIAINETRRFMFDCFLQSKTSKENAQAMADLLTEADYRGVVFKIFLI